MALLDSVSFYANNIRLAIWANGKYGALLPWENNTYIFVEHIEQEEFPTEKFHKTEWSEKCPTVTYGFVSYWLRNRERSTEYAKKLDGIAPGGTGGKTPVEIYGSYIEARKAWFEETMKKQPDAWKYPDLEKLFYEQNLTVNGEEELIGKSMALLEYLDEEDKAEFMNIVKNFLDYVEYIVEPYQHTKEEEAKKKRIEQYTKTAHALVERMKELDEKWPEPNRKDDDREYTIESPEIRKYAEKLTPLQIIVLQELISNAGNIPDREANTTLNQYSEPELWDACCPMFEAALINASFDCGHVFALEIEDKGRLVLRKFNQIQANAYAVSIPEEYMPFVTSVFRKTYRLCEKEIETYPEVANTFSRCIDPNEPAQVPIFIEACINRGCARETARQQADKVVKALIGLGVLEFEVEENQKKYKENVMRKMTRMKGKDLSNNDQELYDSVIKSLNRPVTEGSY